MDRDNFEGEGPAHCRSTGTLCSQLWEKKNSWTDRDAIWTLWTLVSCVSVHSQEYYCLCTCWENYLLVDTFDYWLLLLISLHYFNVQSGALFVNVFG